MQVPLPPTQSFRQHHHTAQQRAAAPPQQQQPSNNKTATTTITATNSFRVFAPPAGSSSRTTSFRFNNPPGSSSFWTRRASGNNSNNLRRRSSSTRHLLNNNENDEPRIVVNMRKWRAAADAAIMCMRLVILGHNGLLHREREEMSEVYMNWIGKNGPVSNDAALVKFLRKGLGHASVVQEAEKKCCCGGDGDGGESEVKTAADIVGYPIQYPISMCVLCQLVGKLKRAAVAANESSDDAVLFSQLAVNVPKKLARSADEEEADEFGSTFLFDDDDDDDDDGIHSTNSGSTDLERERMINAKFNGNKFSSTQQQSTTATGGGAAAADEIVRRVPASFFVETIQRYGFPREIVELFKERASSRPYLTQELVDDILTDPFDNRESISRISTLAQSASMTVIGLKRAQSRIKEASQALMSVLWRGLRASNPPPVMTSNSGAVVAASQSSVSFRLHRPRPPSSPSVVSGGRGSAGGVRALSPLLIASSSPTTTAAMRSSARAPSRSKVAAGSYFYDHQQNNSSDDDDDEDDDEEEIIADEYKHLPHYMRPVREPLLAIKKRHHNNTAASSGKNNKSLLRTTRDGGGGNGEEGAGGDTTADKFKVQADREEWNDKMFNIFGDTAPPPRKTVAEFRFVELATPRRHQQSTLDQVQKKTGGSEQTAFTSSETRWWLRGVTPTGSEKNLSNSRPNSRRQLMRPGTAESFHSHQHVPMSHFASIARSQYRSTSRRGGGGVGGGGGQSPAPPPLLLPSSSPQRHQFHFSGYKEIIASAPAPLPGKSAAEKQKKHQPPAPPKWAKVNPFAEGRGWTEV